MRKLLGRLFGFHREIQELKERVHVLSWDDTFGMWTRGAFLQFCRVMPRGKRTVVFIDLDDIRGKNNALGYDEVNRRIRRAFEISLRRSDIVARWYSGDEIVIIFDSDSEGADRKMEELRASASQQGLTFCHAVGTWDVGLMSIQDMVKRLTETIRTGNLPVPRGSEKENT
jgi:diguanylate cyclase (GGDEF)-like protein